MEENIQFEVGEELYCHTSVRMKTDGKIEFTKDKSYMITGIYGRSITLKNNSGNIGHTFEYSGEAKWSKWFSKPVKELTYNLF